MTDPSTDQPLTRRQRRELEAAAQSTPAQSTPALSPVAQPSAVTPAEPWALAAPPSAVPAAEPWALAAPPSAPAPAVDPFAQFYTQLPGHATPPVAVAVPVPTPAAAPVADVVAVPTPVAASAEPVGAVTGSARAVAVAAAADAGFPSHAGSFTNAGSPSDAGSRVTAEPATIALSPLVASALPERDSAAPLRDSASSVAAPVWSASRTASNRPKDRPRSSPRNLRSPRAARVSSKLFSMVAMLFAGALLVGVSVPANAIMTATVDPTELATAVFVPGQALAVSSDVVEAAASPKRELPTITSYAERLREKYGNRSYTYTAMTGAIRWPFPFASPITDGFGERVAPCRGCSTFHQGVDFTPGNGTPITAIADGTVVFTEVTNSGIGNQVRIEHMIGGSKITSVYAGMQMNSSPMKVGEAVKVGDFVGLVGATGVATGPHLHFELLVGDIKVDPYAWLKKNATNAS